MNRRDFGVLSSISYLFASGCIFNSVRQCLTKFSPYHIKMLHWSSSNYCSIQSAPSRNIRPIYDWSGCNKIDYLWYWYFCWNFLSRSAYPLLCNMSFKTEGKRGHFEDIGINGCTRSYHVTNSCAVNDDNFVKMTSHFRFNEFLCCRTSQMNDADLVGFRLPGININQEWQFHDDVIKWKHFPRYWPFVMGIHRSPVNSSHKDQWRGALMFSLICA